MEPDKGTAAVSLHRATKCFTTPAGKDYTAVHEITLEVQEGTFVAIVGPSGCGKSTLLNMTAGLTAPTSGTVRISRSAASRDQPAGGLYLSAGCAAPLEDGSGQRGARFGVSRPSHRRGPRGGEGVAGKGGARSLRRPVPVSAVRRNAQAGGDRPELGRKSRHLADGRALQRPGRADAADDGERTSVPLVVVAKNGVVRDA